MNKQIEHLKKRIEPLRQEIINHKVYSAIKEIEDLKIFMHYHVFAVWDFMSLLKSLQNELTCTTIPWFPKGSPETRYLINEIVAGEESDVDIFGNRKSHFELYIDAMEQCGSDVSTITSFINAVSHSGNLQTAFEKTNIPIEAREFVDFTFKMINTQKTYVTASIFTFGREDLIPNMFLSIVKDMNKNFPNSISIFNYYLERHIEIDGDHHSELALRMTANLCGKNEQFWQEAEEAAAESLKKRINLWDGVHKAIMERKLK